MRCLRYSSLRTSVQKLHCVLWDRGEESREEGERGWGVGRRGGGVRRVGRRGEGEGREEGGETGVRRVGRGGGRGRGGGGDRGEERVVSTSTTWSVPYCVGLVTRPLLGPACRTGF